ncbi:serine protease [Pseudarthrobacter defluvii]|uniref:S8 family serine peptidase n=1 Tax=Pseudarthrobacter defluvii TaxID=410837 RepID=UPI002780C329|nr:S8 family serine peptidase [Pseudarthrobacter defluvii]MDQ0769115.1 serine protease [Pseudarthrobacter defluvii]
MRTKTGMTKAGIGNRAIGLMVATVVFASATAGTVNADNKPALPPGPSGPASSAGASLPTDQFIVTFKPAAGGSSAERGKTYARAAADTSIAVREIKSTAGDAKVVKANRRLSAAESQRVLESIAAGANVASVEPDIRMYPSATPDDTYYSQQWALSDPNAGIRVPSVWDKTTGTGQIVAVIDTGITAHSDLNSNIIAGYDMIADPASSGDGNGRDADPSDPGDYQTAGACGSGSSVNSSWHGTHVAGIIAAVANNAEGVSGAAPSVKIEPVRALGGCGGYLSDVSDSIIWASGGNVSGVPSNAKPAKTINLSVGGTAPCPSTMQAAIDGAVNRGATVFVAAGNENQPASNNAPANCNNVVTVGATNRSGAKASYSNFGPAVDVMAPGGDLDAGILSTLNAGTTSPGAETYGSLMGTSMATPMAASVGALMKAANSSLTPSQIEAKLKASARPLPGTCSGGCGAGLVDASAAVVFPAAQTPIAAKAASLNGALGAATTGEVYGLKDNGGYQCFEHGCIVYSPATGAHVSTGAIRGLWAATGFENGRLGYPVTDEVSGLRDGGVYQNYQGGAIVWSPATGAHISVGAIRGLWAATGFENGRLGYPVTDEVAGLRDGGVYQNYQGGAIVWSPATGAHISVGAIRGEWAATGFENGVLGYPVTDEVTGLRDGGTYQNYQRGAIVWSPATGAHSSLGATRSIWASLGYESGRLGYPTSDEYPTGNDGSVAQNYQGGVIHWTPRGSYISWQ